MDTKTPKHVNIYVYENREEALNCEPITLTRPVFELRCGRFTLFERLQHLAPDVKFILLVRDELKQTVKEKFPELTVNPDVANNGVWLNGAFIWDKENLLTVLGSDNRRFYVEDRLAAFHLNKSYSGTRLPSINPVETVPDVAVSKKKLNLLNTKYLWDYVTANRNVLKLDKKFSDSWESPGRIDEGTYLEGKENIFIGENSHIMAGAVLNARNGPVIIERNVSVLPGSYLQGPVYIGPNCQIKAGAKIYGNTTFGEGCKIGGEVANTIFQSWSNKQHDGFIGHSYIGEWVNFGAGTNNSDLKNNYSNVKVTVNDQVVDSGSKFVGLFMGDHTKTGINTMFNTGTTIGPACNIVGYGFPPKSIRSFSWVVNGKMRQHLLDKFIKTATVVKSRRDKQFSHNEELLYNYIHQQAMETVH